MANKTNSTASGRRIRKITTQLPARKRAPPPPVRMTKAVVPTTAPASFGPVSTIDTAPVSIGNTISGANAVVIPTKDGIRIKGRDFLCNVDATATSITGFTMVGGAPISPICMVSSAIKGFMNAYANYYIHGVAFHYITAANTGESGTLVLMINKNRAGPGIPTDGSTFLPTILSDHNTVMSPLWKNCSAVFLPPPEWYSTNIFNDEQLSAQSPGELFVFTKSSQNIPQGYILVDYDVSFRNMQASLKQLTLPVSRMKYTQSRLFVSGSLVVNNAVNLGLSGTLMDGATPAAPPSGYLVGDVYKCIFNMNDATLTGFTATTTFRHQLQAGSINVDLSLVDGFTLYAVAITTTNVTLYPNYPAAVAASGQLVWASTQPAGVISIPIYMSLVGSVEGALLQSAI